MELIGERLIASRRRASIEVRIANLTTRIINKRAKRRRRRREGYTAELKTTKPRLEYNTYIIWT